MKLENPRADELVAQLSALTGEDPGDVVIKALEQRLRQERQRAQQRQALRSIAKQFRDAAPLGLNSDHSFLYDEFGLPK
jgi:hypothetical protein